MCQSTKGGCTFSECNIIALEAGTRMPLNQSRSLGLGLQFHILSPSPPLFFRSLPLPASLLLHLLLLLVFSPPSLRPLSRLVPSFSLVFCCPRVPPRVLPISRYPSTSLFLVRTSFHPDRNYKQAPLVSRRASLPPETRHGCLFSIAKNTLLRSTVLRK